MPLILEPEVADPFSQILDALAEKIADPALSFQKFLIAEGLPALNVYDQTIEADQRHAYDPPLSLCPAVTLLTSAHPPAIDRGPGNEVWHFEVAVFFKMELPQRDARTGLHAFWELIRTCMVGHKQPALDPIGSIPNVADYWMEGEIQPPTSTEREGFRVARGVFILRFRFCARVMT